ncbi:hypothetical protein ABZ281_41035, partial [Streptomyces sp. NPDC006265]
LSAQIDLESGALRHWTEPEPQPASSQQSAASRQPGSPARSATPPPWPEVPAADAATADQTWPDTAQSSPEQGSARPAITPPGPRPTYPWQKKPRPESTT